MYGDLTVAEYGDLCVGETDELADTLTLTGTPNKMPAPFPIVSPGDQ